MKKKLILRVIGIGMFHAVPFVIRPKFGNNGFKFAVAVAIIISIAVLGTILLETKNKRREK
jgi:hypothetical protein